MKKVFVSAGLREKMTERMLRMAGTPQGWGAKSTPDMHAGTAREIARQLVAEGRLFAGTIAGGFRYFSTPQLRDVWALTRHKAAGRPAGAGTKNCAEFKPGDDAYVPAHVQVQRAPTPKGRFEVVGPVVGGFLSDWHTKRGTHAAA